MKALYRIAEQKNKYDKNKPNWVDNIACLRNFRGAFKGDLIVFGDRLNENTKKLVKELSDDYIDISQHGNAQSFREVFLYATNNYGDDDIVYFVEDDYIHKSNFEKIILEGLEVADYVSLYDHPDKHIQGLLITTTKSTHWLEVPSTTMTFAAKVETLKDDWYIFDTFTSDNHPHEHHIFTTLTTNLLRKLITPIPGWSTHGETNFLSPVVNWERYAK